MKKYTIIIIGVLILSLALVSTGASGGVPKLQLTDTYLNSPSFTYTYGPGSLTSKTDLHKKGVGFALSDITGGATGISDDWWGPGPPGPDTLSGLAPHSTWGFFSDAMGFGKLKLKFKNLGTQGVDVNVFMNTGFTDDPFGAPAHDTYWGGTWTYVAPGKTKIVTLDFSNANAWKALDDPTHTLLTAGSHPGVSIVRLDEVTNIGFQVADFSSGGPTDTWLVVSGG